jgi:hypothetical protein
MHKKSVQKRDLAAATRGLIVQRVLVDGWTPEKAGSPFGVDERVVTQWVAAFRRHGMAALRGEVAVEGGLRRWIRRCAGWITTCAGVSKRGAVTARIHGSGAPDLPTRRWRWN